MNERFNKLATCTTQSLAHMVIRKEDELTALREKCAELQKDRDEWKESCIDANQRFKDAENKVRELQRQLDEAAKQEPVAYKAFKPNPDGTYSVLLSEQRFNPVGISWQVPLIEQAKADEVLAAIRAGLS